ncbi:SRPBCC family protein [Actinomadura madurae]|uniref:SRPBCC family protein n=1 Tax=Actinomadura madurae TaxID=1993 RepID=UPI0020271134|nr:SRPBCC family protein [Actinomadura madurae]MCP9948085.1 SRPBCC family protein [Actinomadura madurae]MCP9964852.1 SRPBCC family protein [Actinomadura madurae]MCP9977340.1 SRPBCC family protein [Actinomadura madurae]MCQ0011151.1 SRPBCC family protein [Actinomadura madurae]MCQ0013523.1 SRPBCC family protein [Actinomadura madurae]
MGQVVVTTERTLNAGPDRVLAALGDYTGVRSRILTEHFSEYDVREGGQGEGTVVHWKLAATSKRVRDCLFTASTPGKDRLVERDANSSMVTTWTVSPAGDTSRVQVTTTWDGAGGIGGFFEKTFAPKGLRRIYDAQLEKLDAELGT